MHLLCNSEDTAYTCVDLCSAVLSSKQHLLNSFLRDVKAKEYNDIFEAWNICSSPFASESPYRTWPSHSLLTQRVKAEANRLLCKCHFIGRIQSIYAMNSANIVGGDASAHVCLRLIHLGILQGMLLTRALFKVTISGWAGKRLVDH